MKLKWDYSSFKSNPQGFLHGGIKLLAGVKDEYNKSFSLKLKYLDAFFYNLEFLRILSSCAYPGQPVFMCLTNIFYSEAMMAEIKFPTLRP